MTNSAVTDGALPTDLAATPLWFAQNFDPASGRVLLARRSEDNYRAASFLDARSLTTDFERRIVSWDALAEALPADAREDAQFIFHIGHVGSTLISRLLGELEDVLALREPLLLRIFAGLPPGRRAAIRPALVKLLSRTFRTDQRAMIKATSFTSEVAAELLPSASRALFLYAAPRRYIEGILAGDASRQELAALGPGRLARLEARCGSLPPPDSSEATAAAISWACEMTSLEANAERIDANRTMWLDFDSFLTEPPAHLVAVAHFFGHPIDAGQAQALCAGPLMQRYSKALEYEYSPALRREVLAEAARTHGSAIDRAMRWLDEAAACCPLVAKAIARGM